MVFRQVRLPRFDRVGRTGRCDIPGTYDQVGGAGDIQQVSPYADATYNLITQMLGGNIGGDIVGQWLGTMPQIQGMAAGINSPYGAARMEQAESMADQLRMDIASKYAREGNLRSSGFGRAVGKGVSQVMGGALTDIIGREQALAGQFGMGALGAFGQGMQARTGLLSSLASQYGPTFYEPTYQYTPGVGDYLLSGLGTLGQLAGGIGALV